MVNIGDIVLATIRTWEPSREYFYNNVSALQGRLQQAGFRVLRIDDSGLGFNYGDLLVTVIPLQSAYGSANDVASIVAGAAEAVGYGNVSEFHGQVISQSGYEQNLKSPNLQSPKSIFQHLGLDPDGDGNPNFPDLPKLPSSAPWLFLGGVAVFAVLWMRR